MCVSLRSNPLKGNVFYMECVREDSCGSTAVFPVPMLQRTKSSVVVVVEEKKRDFTETKKKESVFSHPSA